MDRFIEIPNTPNRKVSLAVVDGRIGKEIEKKLYELNIKIIKTEKIDTYDAISYHPDIMLHHLGKDKILIAPNISEKLAYSLEDEGFMLIVGNSNVEHKYPKDIAYNVARVGDKAICNIKFTDEILLKELMERKIKIIDVKQGYAKCSISVVNDKAIITSDKGIAKTLIKFDIDVLLIKPGFIKLSGLNYGFIGGATGLISKDCLAFFGSLNHHPEGNLIKSFLSKNNVSWIELSESYLIDYGTIIPLKEYSIVK